MPPGANDPWPPAGAAPAAAPPVIAAAPAPAPVVVVAPAPAPVRVVAPAPAPVVVVAHAPARYLVIEPGSIELPPGLDGSRRQKRIAWIVTLFLIVGFTIMITATIMSHNRPH
jgi:hypothetical protein